MVGQNMSGVDYKEELYNPTQGVPSNDLTNLGPLSAYVPNAYI